MRCLIAVAALILVPGSAFTQGGARELPLNSNVVARLRDGSTIYGRLERLGTDSLVVIGSAGRLAIARANIRDVRDAGVAHARADGSNEYWFPNSNTTRLLFAPTGRTLGRGEGYFADHDIVIGSIAVGVTDRLTIGGGTLIIPNSDFWFVTPKVGIVRGDNFNLAVGALFGGVGSETGGIGYVAATIGGTDRSLTAAVGNGFAGGTASQDQVFMLGGETRVSRRISLITENYFGTGFDDALLSYGVRFLGEKFSVDLAFMNSAKNGVFPGIPYVDFVWKW